jgi:hypothetical protein
MRLEDRPISYNHYFAGITSSAACPKGTTASPNNNGGAKSCVESAESVRRVAYDEYDRFRSGMRANYGLMMNPDLFTNLFSIVIIINYWHHCCILDTGQFSGAKRELLCD